MIVAIITHALTVPAPVEIGQTIESLLDEGELSFFQFSLPAQGMTFQLQVQQGRVVMYASSQIRNPSAALYDVRLHGNLLYWFCIKVILRAMLQTPAPESGRRLLCLQTPPYSCPLKDWITSTALYLTQHLVC